MSWSNLPFIISHNLRNPVANILGINDLLKGQNINAKEQASLLEGLSHSVEKLDSIIVDLNNIMQAKQSVNENREFVAFGKLVDDVTYSVQNIVDASAATILCDFGGALGMNTVKSYLYSIFYNLITNSLKYRRADVLPVITIKSGHVGDGIVIEFADNGIGIDLERKGSQVFGLYKRFHAGLAEGKGLGLFMVKTHVETLGGKIEISSKVNEGTVFTIRFDAAAVVQL